MNTQRIAESRHRYRAGVLSRWGGVAALALLFLAPLVAHAGPVEERLRALEEEVRQLRSERDKAVAEQPDPEDAVDKPAVEALIDDKLKKQKLLAGWQDGFFLQSPSGDFKLKLRGYAQADYRFFPSDDGDTGSDSFFLRRVRPIFEGTVYKYFDFRIMPDFGGGSTVLQDGYMDVRYFPLASLRAGKFKEPISLERLQSGAEMTFIERSIAQNIAPNRDVGLQLYGDYLEGLVSYQLGIFNGVSDGGSSDGETATDKDVAARIFSHPFKTTDIGGLKGLGVGLAGSYGRHSGESLSGVQYRTAGRSTFFRYVADAEVEGDGNLWRVAPQIYHYWGPFGFMAEYFVSQGNVQGTADEATVEEKQTSRGWFAQASWVLTGEPASFKQIAPINAFDPWQGRWGAFEVAARASQVDIDDNVFDAGLASGTDGATAYTAGVNWYLNRAFKFQLNYERTEFDGEPRFSGQGRDHEDVLISRFQIAF